LRLRHQARDDAWRGFHASVLKLSMAADAAQLDRRLGRRAVLAARPSYLLYGVLIAGIVALFPTWFALGKLWRESADYQHGFLLAAIVVYWLVQLRGRIDTTTDVTPFRLAILPLAASLLCWMIASRANSELMQQLLIPVIAMLSVLAILGPRVARQAAPPILFIYYVIPAWDHLVPLLQAMTTWATEHVLALLDVPTVVEGNDVSIPAGRFTIADACAGKRYLIVGLACATLLGTLQGLRRVRLFLLLAATVITALLLNWLRVVTIIYAGHVSDMQHYLVAKEHLTFGWLVFLPLLAIVALIARRLERGEEPSSSPSLVAESMTSTRAPITAMWPLLLFIVPPVLMAGHASANVGGLDLGHLPVLTGSWQGPLPANMDWQPKYEAPSAERRGAYLAAGGEIVEVYLNVYGRQEQGRELIFVGNSLTPAPTWTVVPGRSYGGGLATFTAIHSGQRWVLGQSFQVGGAITESQAVTQLQLGVRSLWRPVPSGTVALASRCLPDCSQAELRLRTFWRDERGLLTNLIPIRL
jgi:exosortase A